MMRTTQNSWKSLHTKKNAKETPPPSMSISVGKV